MKMKFAVKPPIRLKIEKKIYSTAEIEAIKKGSQGEKFPTVKSLLFTGDRGLVSNIAAEANIEPEEV